MGNGEQDQEAIRRAEENALYEAMRKLYGRHRNTICNLFGVEEENDYEDAEEDQVESMEDEPKVPQ